MRTHVLTPVRSVAAAMLVAAAACGPSSLPDVNPVSIVVGGLAPLERPGDVVQLSATATFSDGSTRDVTAEVSWYCVNSFVANVEQNGLVKATGWGTADIVATYMRATARAKVRVAPAGMFLISGHVSGTDSFAHISLPDSSVTVTFASGEVEVVTTNGAGNFTIPAQGEVTLCVEKTGYNTQEQQLTVDHDMEQVSFDLQPLGTSGNLYGRYGLTFTASPTCTLAAEVMQRQYTATVLGDGRLLTVDLSGADMVAWVRAGFDGTREGDTVRFEILDGSLLENAVFWEQLDPDRILAFSGIATGSIGDGTISAAFSGRVQVRTVSGGLVLAECNATDHRFEFVR